MKKERNKSIAGKIKGIKKIVDSMELKHAFGKYIDDDLRMLRIKLDDLSVDLVLNAMEDK